LSYELGMAALNLQKTDRVPRTEYSAAGYWELIKKVCNIEVDANSSKETKLKASQAFIKAWDYSFVWTVLTNNEIFDGYCTSMGHAEYASGGTDFDNEVSCPFKTPEDVLAFDPWQQYGGRDTREIVKGFDEQYDMVCGNFNDAVNMTGIYVTLVSGLIEIFGWDMMLMAAGTDPEKFGQLTDRYASWIQQYFDALAESKAPVVMVHDDIVWTSGPFISPDWYRKHIFPNYKKLFAPLIESGKKIIYTSDGNFTEFIDDVADTGVNGFVLEPTTDMKYIADKYGKTHSFIGNADCRILTFGTRDEIKAEVARCMAIGKDCPGFFMACGNHLPSSVPVENAIFYNEIFEELSRR